jgi:hypothetical protein
MIDHEKAGRVPDAAPYKEQLARGERPGLIELETS